MDTLENILTKERKNRVNGGPYGMDACMEEVKFQVNCLHKDIFTLLGEYVQRANEDKFFNRRMILACWEMVND